MDARKARVAADGRGALLLTRFGLAQPLRKPLTDRLRAGDSEARVEVALDLFEFAAHFRLRGAAGSLADSLAVYPPEADLPDVLELPVDPPLVDRAVTVT